MPGLDPLVHGEGDCGGLCSGVLRAAHRCGVEKKLWARRRGTRRRSSDGSQDRGRSEASLATLDRSPSPVGVAYGRRRTGAVRRLVFDLARAGARLGRVATHSRSGPSTREGRRTGLVSGSDPGCAWVQPRTGACSLRRPNAPSPFRLPCKAEARPLNDRGGQSPSSPCSRRQRRYRSLVLMNGFPRDSQSKSPSLKNVNEASRILLPRVSQMIRYFPLGSRQLVA